MARKRKTEDTGFGEGAAAGTSRPRLTPVDVQQKVFRLAFRGYNERDVDEFLDQVTEDLAALHEENKRLREQVHDASGTGDVQGAQRQAETIVRQAREHAARLIEDAERRAGAPAGAGGRVSSSFLVRERDFLQRLASMVQSHARELKEEAGRARASASAGTAPAAGEERRPATEPAPEEQQAEVSSAQVAEARSPERSGNAPAGDEDQHRPGSPGAATPWGPAERETGEVTAEPPRAVWPNESEERDPLISAWESAFAAGGTAAGEGPAADQGAPSSARGADEGDEEGEPSLRELFWGEEG